MSKQDDKEILNEYPKIPPEFVDTLNFQDLGYSWLIKGQAGVGKTTFALSVLNFFKQYEPVYLSTRVAPASIYAQFPYLNGHLKEINILDATRTYIPPVGHPERMKEHLNNTLRFSSVPDFLKIIYEKVAQYESPIIVIDSWDAIINHNPEEKKNIETLLTEYIRNTKAKLIFIAESDEFSLLDYIVDGILTLKDESIAGRTLRTIHIKKIRAVERRQKAYVYTLHNNQFQYAGFQRRNVNFPISTFNSTEDKNDLFSTGNITLDNIYGGGLRPGTFNLLEVDSNVPISSISSIFIGILCQFIKNGRGAIVHATDGINSDLIDKKRLFLYLQTDAISKNMRILQTQISDRKEIRPYIRLVDDDTYNDVFFDTYSKLSSSTKFQPVFAGISYDSIQFMVNFNNAMCKFEEHLKLIRNSNVIELGIINSSSSIESKLSQELGALTVNLSYVASTHIKIIEKHGTVLLYAIKPRSSCLYAMRSHYDKGYPQIELLPIV